MTKKTTSRCRMALLMAVYTFLLALGAALPVAASYGRAIQGRASQGHIQGGAHQRRESTDATSEDQAQPEAPRERRAALTDGAALCVEVAPCGAPTAVDVPRTDDPVGS